MPLKFTEHALFRYCQRVLGADVDWLTDSLRARLQGIDKDGTHKLTGADAYAIIKEGFVVTIMTKDQLKALRKKPKMKWRFREAKGDY